MNRKRGLFLVSILISSLFMVIVPFYSVAAEPVRVYVDPPSSVDPPVFFNVSVNVENVVGLAGAQWQLTWDPTLLSAVNMTEVMFHQVTPQSEWGNIQILWHDIDNVIGRVRYSYDYLSSLRAEKGGYFPISGNYTMAFITFQVKDVGNCSLNLSSGMVDPESLLADQNANAIAHQDVDGFFSNSVPPPNLATPLSSAQVLVYVDPHQVRNESLGLDSTFSVAVKLNMIADDSGMLYVNFNISWDPALLDCVNVTDVIMHEVTPESEWDNLDSRVYLDSMQGSLECDSGFLNDSRALSEGYWPFFGNHTVAIVTFRVKDAGVCLLHLSDFRAATLPSNSVLLYATIDGFFTNTLNGDLNRDNAVNMLDAILMSGYFGATRDDLDWNEAADFNGDGVVNILDAILLCQCFGHTR